MKETNTNRQNLMEKLAKDSDGSTDPNADSIGDIVAVVRTGKDRHYQQEKEAFEKREKEDKERAARYKRTQRIQEAEMRKAAEDDRLAEEWMREQRERKIAIFVTGAVCTSSAILMFITSAVCFDLFVNPSEILFSVVVAALALIIVSLHMFAFRIIRKQLGRKIYKPKRVN